MVLIDVSPGEIADKVSILKIKSEYITDEKKLENIRNELVMLEPHVAVPLDELYRVNKLLWDIENEIRLFEKRSDFGPEFVRLARLVYITNDTRARLKREINSQSSIAEEKQYADYAHGEKPRLVVMTHMGLGDHFVCNGLIRHFAKTYSVVTYVKKHYAESVCDLFRDIHVTIIPVDGDDDAWTRSLNESNVIRTGIFYGPRWNVVEPWCDSFYVNAGVNPIALREEFFVLRSRDREKAFYRKIVSHIGTNKYVVVHDDPSRFDPIRITTQLPIIRIGRGLFPIESNTIFDYCELIARAEEYHGFDSSFAWLIELLQLRPKVSTFMHRYIKGKISPGYEEFTQFFIISHGTPPY